uniref:Uncharacterized protein n=1 Tax=Mimivirus LCMiAC01 TaxID=2506608 RepID=A0A481Z1F8_9VIRU|nr:MAG: hypothetical protein LCMiAC01_02810 [Mimivirus LCMiAC01]
MDNILELKKKILSIIANDKYDVNDLNKLIDPLNTFIGNDLFMANMKQMIDVIIKDRNGDNVITIKDIELIGQDIFAITSLIKGILLILNTIPQLKLKYNAGATEELIFKILMYVFLVIIPREAKLNWTFEEKEQIADLVIVIYDMIKSSQVAKDLIANIVSWLKEKKICKYLCKGTEPKEDIIERHLSGIKAELKASVLKDREMVMMSNKLQELEKKFDEAEFVYETDSEDEAEA